MESRFNNKNMKKILNASEMGKIGGRNRWAKIPKEERSKMMREVRLSKLNK